jgi:PhzF family phenazine biosynthesis protein
MAKTITVHIVNAFVVDDTGGNAAGVVLDADGLSEADMQQVAAAVGVSETVFVSKSSVAAFRFDFFTPNMRIPHCGHATIAAFSYLVSIGLVGEGVTSKETVDGPRRILIRAGIPYMEQLAPEYDDPANWMSRNTREQDVADSLGLNSGLLDKRVGPVVVNTGNRFLLVGVQTADTLRSIVPDLEAITAVSEKLNLIGYYVYTTQCRDAGRDASTRMFAPRYAIPEEAATGMAAGTLGCLLYDRVGIQKRRFSIEQGLSMQPASESHLTVELEVRDGQISGVLVGGAGKLMRTTRAHI